MLPVNEQPLQYALYGLNGKNPFEPRVLDPFEDPDDFSELLGLDGFVRIEAITKHIQTAIDQDRPSFFVVSGRDRTGRTSVANCILHMYQQLRGLGDHFLPGRVTVANHNDQESLGRALAQLQNEVDFAALDLDHRTLRLLNELEDIATSRYEQRLQAVAYMIARDLARLKTPHGFGLLFEGIRTGGLIASAQAVFQRAPSVIVFTHSSYDHSQTTMADQINSATLDDSVHLVHLRPLASPQINELAARRWNAASPHDCPYDRAGLDRVYRNEPMPIKAVLHQLARLLDYRLRTNVVDEPWPENRHLGMPEEWLIATMTLLDQQQVR
ncbi:hypothetical protein [Catellatospora sichuanensis]|uniref:hypothetical protein n=1 Tax=Catellatospora sichuanensis TaxID=1969805 RepID=UPI0011821342|nr:hypothetical protein [Catellatospora sichuanensis]